MKRIVFLGLLFIAGCRSGTPANTAFDVPALIGQDFDSIQSSLGKPSESEISNGSQSAARFSKWEDSKGNYVAILFSATTKKPASLLFYIPDAEASPDHDKVLRAGNLSLDDKRYSLKFLILEGDKNRVAGVQIKPLEP